jgi:hypothetical protein
MHPKINIPHLLLLNDVYIRLENSAFKLHSNVGRPRRIDKSFATESKGVGAELENCVMGVEVEGPGDEYIKVAVRGLFGGFGRDNNVAKVEADERENQVGDGLVLREGHARSDEPVGFHIERASTHSFPFCYQDDDQGQWLG